MNQDNHRIYGVSFADVYPHYISKAERKGRTKAEVDEIIRWLTGYSQQQFETCLQQETTLEDFYSNAPQMNPGRSPYHRRDLWCTRRGDQGADHAGDPLSRQADR